MSDFEDRLGRALGEGAEDAPGAGGLADGARGRAQRRRARRAMAGAAAAVVAIAIPIAVVSARSGPTERGTELPPASALALPRVTCGGGPSWEVETMDGGLPNAVDDAEVRAAFAGVLREAPVDAPIAIQEQGPERADYIVLASGGDSYTLGLRGWTINGPSRNAMTADLKREPDGSLRMTSWGDCRRLEIVVAPDRILVEVTAPAGGVLRTTDAPVVMVTESDCTGGRDPSAFLGKPAVTEDSSRVVVNLTSEAIIGGADCPGNPSVPLTLSLDEPIGDRELYDGGTFPPTPIKLAGPSSSTDDEWQTVTYERDPNSESGDNRVLLDLPLSWEPLGSRGCGFGLVTYGEPGLGCRGAAVRVYGEASLDYAGPALADDAQSSSGLVVTGEFVVIADGADYGTIRRVLASVRLPGDPAPSPTWTTVWLGRDKVDLPDDGSVTAEVATPSGVERLPTRVATQNPDGTWSALVARGEGTAIHVIAPTQALADMVASTVRPAAG